MGRTAWWLLVALLGTVGACCGSIVGVPAPPRVVLAGDLERFEARDCVAPTAWQVVMGGTVDGVMCRGPMQNWKYAQTWQPNVEVVIANTGATAIRNPRLVVNGQRDWRTTRAIAAEATAGLATPAEQARGIFEFVRNGMYNAYPSTEEAREPWRAFNCFGYGLCSESTVVLGDLWQAVGLPSRIGIYTPNHTAPEVFYDGAWHFMDASSHALILDGDNRTVASSGAVATDPLLARRWMFSGQAAREDYDRDHIKQWMASQFVWPTGIPHWPRTPVAMPDWELLPGATMSWRWSHVGKHYSLYASAFSDYADPNLISNGLLLYEPDLAVAAGRLGLVAQTNVAPPTGGMTGLRPLVAASPMVAVWKMALPWPLVGGRLDLGVTRASTADQVTLSISRDGTRYEPVARAEMAGTSSLSAVLDDWLSPRTRQVADRELWVRVEVAPQAGEAVVLDSLGVALDVQMNLLALPELRLGVNQVEYRADSFAGGRVRVTQRWFERTAWQPPAAPVPLRPTGGAAATGLTFEWGQPASPDGVAQYQLQVSDRSDVRWPLTPFFDRLTTATRWTLPQAGLLDPATTYYWRVRASSSRGVWGPWSQPLALRIGQPARPTNVTLTPAADGSGYRLHWAPGAGGTAPLRYRVYGSSEQGFTPQREPYQVLVGVGSVTTPAEYEARRQEVGTWLLEPRPANHVAATAATELPVAGPGAVANGQHYYWRVVAEDSAGNLSAPSDCVALPSPVFVSRPTARLNLGEALDYQPELVVSQGRLTSLGPGWAAFWDTMRPTWSLAAGPTGLAVDRATGRLTGTPPVGLHLITIRASTTWNVLQNYTWPALPQQTDIQDQSWELRVVGPPASLVLSEPPSHLTVDQPFSVTVTVQDAAECGLTVPVAVRLEGPAGEGPLGGTTTLTASDGTAVFSGLRIAQPGSDYRLVVTAGGVTTRSATFVVWTGRPQASQSLLEAGPQLAADGLQTLDVVVTLRDAKGWPVADEEPSAIALSAEPSTGVTWVPPRAPSDAAGRLVARLRTTALGTLRLTARVGGEAIPGEVTVAAVPGPPASLAFLTAPTAVTQGAPLPPVAVEARDAAGHRAATDLPVRLSLDGDAGATLGGATELAASDGLATFRDVTISRAGRYTLSAAAADLAGASAGPWEVRGPARLAFRQPPGNVVAGDPLAPIQVEVQDATGALVPNATGTVDLSLHAAAGEGELQGTVTAPVTNGVASFTDLKITRHGTGYTLSAACAGLPPVVSGTFAVDHAAPARLVVRAAPAAGVAGEPLSPALVVVVEDPFGNLVSDAAPPVTVALHTGPPGAVLAGATTVDAAAGVASFDRLVLERAAAGYALVVSAPNLTRAVSPAFVVRPAAVDGGRSTATVEQVGARADGVETVAVTVTARDAYDNPIPEVPATDLVVGVAPPLLVASPPAATDPAGQTTVRVASLATGTWSLPVAIRGVALATPVTVRFMPRLVAASQSVVDPPARAIGADGTEDVVLQVTLRSADGAAVEGSAVSDREVSIEGATTDGRGLRLTDRGQTTGDDGRFALRLTASTPDTYAVQVTIAGVALAPVEVRARAVFRASLPAGLHFLGAPARLDDPSPAAVLGGPPTPPVVSWDAGAQAFVEAATTPEETLFQFTPGRGQFVRLTSPTDLRLLGEAVTGPVDLPLQSGWNALANPFNEPLHWDLTAIRVLVDGADLGPLADPSTWSVVAPYAWLVTGEQPRLLLDPTQLGAVGSLGVVPRLSGLWVYCASDLVTLRLAPPSRARMGWGVGPASPRNWTLSMVAQCADGHRATGFVGVSENVGGRLPLLRPPLLSDPGLQISFLDGDSRVRLAGEVRSWVGAESTWRMMVTSDQAGDVVLSWPRLGRQLPPGSNFHLTDLQTGQSVLLNARQSYRFTATRPGEERAFDLTVRFGRLERSRIVSLTTTRARGRGLALAVTLTGPAEVRTLVRGLGGRLVCDLGSQSLPAGASTITWNGRDQHNRYVPAGSYTIEAVAISPDGLTSRVVQTVTVN